MKKPIHIFLVLLVLTLVMLLWPLQPRTSGPSLSTNPLADAEHQLGKEHSSKPATIQNRDDELTVRKEEPVDLGALGIDTSSFKNETEDTALIQILATYQSPSVGSVRAADAGGFILDLPGGRHFEAAVIGRTRSESQNGIVALEAVTVRNGPPLKIIEGETIPGNPGEIWVIDIVGKPERISPPHVHAEHPIISPNGRYIAFVGRYLAGNALRPKVLLIMDRGTGQLSSYADRRYGADYEISPIDWVEEGRVLRVIENWGETGGHLQLKQVRVQ